MYNIASVIDPQKPLVFRSETQDSTITVIFDKHAPHEIKNITVMRPYSREQPTLYFHTYSTYYVKPARGQNVQRQTSDRLVPVADVAVGTFAELSQCNAVFIRSGALYFHYNPRVFGGRGKK